MLLGRPSGSSEIRKCFQNRHRNYISRVIIPGRASGCIIHIIPGSFLRYLIAPLKIFKFIFNRKSLCRHTKQRTGKQKTPCSTPNFGTFLYWKPCSTALIDITYHWLANRMSWLSVTSSSNLLSKITSKSFCRSSANNPDSESEIRNTSNFILEWISDHHQLQWLKGVIVTVCRLENVW